MILFYLYIIFELFLKLSKHIIYAWYIYWNLMILVQSWLLYPYYRHVFRWYCVLSNIVMMFKTIGFFYTTTHYTYGDLYVTKIKQIIYKG